MSEAEYAEQYVAECGWNGIPASVEMRTGPYGEISEVNVFEELGSAIDMEYITHEMFITDWRSAEYDGETYIFRAH